MEEIKRILEALIFASEMPLSLGKIKQLLEDVDDIIVEQQLQALMQEYRDRKGGFLLQEVAGGYQFRTTSDLARWIRKLRGTKYSLSHASMETLAVIAYRQPVVKAEIDAIRGVDAGGAIKKLIEKKIIRIVGRKDIPGKPIIYGTTSKFLEVFNLKDLSELPTLQELAELEQH